MKKNTELTKDLLTDTLDKNALVQELRKSRAVSFFLLDIDNFTNINDAYGYEIGDAVLVEVANLLDIIKPTSSRLYRFGADKFVLLDEKDLNEYSLSQIAESILSFFSQTEIIIDDEREFNISFSSCVVGCVLISNLSSIESLRATGSVAPV